MSGDNTSINNDVKNNSPTSMNISQFVSVNGSYPFTHNTAFVTHPSHPLPPAQYPVDSVMFPATYGYTFLSQAPMFPQVIPYPYYAPLASPDVAPVHSAHYPVGSVMFPATYGYTTFPMFPQVIPYPHYGYNGTPGAFFSSTYIPRAQLTYSRNGIYPVQAAVLPHAFPIMTFQDLTRNMDTGASSHLADNTGFYTTSMADEPQDHNMHGKPLFDILLKLPWKSLLRFRCVSKLWREYIDDSYFVSIHDKQVIDTPIIFYLNNSQLEKTLCFHTIESDPIANDVFQFVVKKSTHKTCYTKYLGSCNGLILIENRDMGNYPKPTFSVIHPINKQCYVLPKLPYKCDDEVSCGLGFDSSTNTFKVVCVYANPDYPFNYWNMVHVFGTNSWRYIPTVPYCDISSKAIFAHGCLYWFVHEEHCHEDGTRELIWFDVKNEEFGLIKPPKTKSKPTKRKCNHPSYDHLVILDGQLGYFVNKTTEVWVLNHKKEWMLHCGFEDNEFPHDSFIEVLGCLNKDRDILIRVTKCFYIYNLKNRVIHKAHIAGLDLEDGCETEIVMFPNSLCDIITNSSLFKK